MELANIELITSDFLQLTSDAFNPIERMVNSKKSNETSSSSVSTVSLPVPDVVSVQPTTKSASCWVKHGDITLTKRHLQDLVNGKELIDLHVNEFQNIVKVQFSHYWWTAEYFVSEVNPPAI